MATACTPFSLCLNVAIAQGKQPAAAATILLESYGMHADSADPNGTTPLHLAARGGDASLAELLTGPTGRADPGMKDGEGNQPLHIAAACGHLDVVKVMVEKAGADLGQLGRAAGEGGRGGRGVRVFM